MKPDHSLSRLTTRALPALAVTALVAAAMGVPFALGAAPTQTGSTLFLPDMQAGEKSFLAAHANAARPQDQEGFGETEVEVQNRSQAANSVELVFEPKSGTSRASLKRSLGPRQAVRLQTRAEAAIKAGFFSGQLLGSQPLGAIARVRWVSGANSAYEAAPAAKDIILPLIARTVYSHTSYIFVQNADPGPDRNKIDMTFWDNENGSILKQVGVTADPGETASWDTAFDQLVFGPDELGTNAPTGGWIGHVVVRGEGPVAALAYGDELNGKGSSAYVGRPVAAADAIQYLPLVRANYKGDSLIAVANAGNGTLDVTIEYRGADFSPSGAGQTFSQSFQITPRGSRFVDLSTRGRGTVPPPGLPRGGREDQGFIGSAVVRASGPVLAVAQDEQLKAGRVDSVSAYNAFGPKDLGTVFGAPVVRRTNEFLSTTLLVFNPGSEPLPVAVLLLSSDNQPQGSMALEVPAGGLARASLLDQSGLANGAYRAELSGDSPFAALLYDERDLSADPGGAMHSIKIRDFADSGISGTADLTEKGADMEVAIELHGASAGPGTTLKATIRKGICGQAYEVRNQLNDVKDGKSTTTVKGTSIDDLTITPHALVIQHPGGGFPTDVACGFIEEIHTGETTDTMLAWPVKLADGGSVVTPGTPTATATTAPPTLTATPTTPGPTPASPTPPSPSATPTDTTDDIRVYLPFARK